MRANTLFTSLTSESTTTVEERLFHKYLLRNKGTHKDRKLSKNCQAGPCSAWPWQLLFSHFRLVYPPFSLCNQNVRKEVEVLLHYQEGGHHHYGKLCEDRKGYNMLQDSTLSQVQVDKVAKHLTQKANQSNFQNGAEDLFPVTMRKGQLNYSSDQEIKSKGEKKEIGRTFPSSLRNSGI